MRRAMEGGGRFEGEDGGGRRNFLDRSKLRVLLCDKDPKSSQEVLQLLYNCSYKVTTVRTAKQVIDMLSICGAEIDIVLAEADLPIAKGLKMLKCIARKKELRRIPIILMSSQDEVSVIVNCLRLGAADYLVKPLRTNELLNLWTHSWRRRRMLGLAEKDYFNQGIELILSDPSDANTNSTALLSEDTDERIRTTHQEITFTDQGEDEFGTSAALPSRNILAEKEAGARRDANLAVFSGQSFSRLRKTDLKVGESSAFFTYVKSNPRSSNSNFSHVDEDARQSELVNGEENLFHPWPTEEQPEVHGMQPIFHLPIYIHGHPSSMEGSRQSPGSLLPQYNVLPQPHHAHMMHHLAYHHAGISLPPGAHPWPSPAISHPQPKSGPAERRAAALVKFKQKRKDRCYDKKIRYVNRKHLAEKRPRVRGQFVRLSGSRLLQDDDSDEEDDEHLSREVELMGKKIH